MDSPEILDDLFREAVSAIDAGDVTRLERLLAARIKTRKKWEIAGCPVSAR